MPMELGWHPHSGIATVTVVLEGAVRYAETTGKAGVLPAGGVEWMRAGNGVWHTGARRARGRRGIPALGRAAARAGERAEREPLRDARGVPVDGPVRVILGSHGERRARSTRLP